MRYQVNHSPSFATLDLHLDLGDSVFGQPNSMLSMTPGIEINKRRSPVRPLGAVFATG